MNMLHFLQVTYPKRTDKPLYHGLVKQLESLDIPFLPADDVTEGSPLRERYDVVIDAIFGFSFHGSPRPPFDTIVQVLRSASLQLGSEPCVGRVRIIQESSPLRWPSEGINLLQGCNITNVPTSGFSLRGLP